MSRPVAIAAVLIAVLVAAGWGISALIGGSSSIGPTAQSGALDPRLVSWMGMEIATQAPGVAVVQTVKLETPADRAGINPGDVILAVNGRELHSAVGIVGAVRGMAAGSRVTLQVAYGSNATQIEIPLSARPAVAP